MPAPSRDSSSSRALLFFLGAVSLIALWALTRSWHASILDRYEFRQLQTALSTYWIVQDGWQWNYLTPLFGPPWSIPMEFPLYQGIVATLHQLTGLPLEPAGRLTGILFLFACLPAVYDLLSLAHLPPSRRLIVLALVLTSPVYLFYARAFMIETTALCFAVWFLALFRRALLDARIGWISAALLAATLAALTKITTFLVFGLPAAGLAVAAFRRARANPGQGISSSRCLGVSLLVAAVSLILAWCWIRHGDTVKDSNPFTGFLTARELRAWNFGPLALRLDWSYWIHLQEVIAGYILAEGAFAVALLCVPFAPARTRWIAALAGLGFLSGPLVFANLYHIHDYYYAANALLLVGAAGLLLASVWDDARLPRGANWLALVIMLTCQGYAFYRGYYSHHRNPAPPPPALAGLIREAVPADGVVLIYGADWNPLLPYYSQRRALMIPGERENETDVLELILAQLPPRRIAAMVIHGEKLRARPDFIRERAARFGLAAAPFARSGPDELYLPAAAPAGSSAGTVEILTLPATDALSQSLKTDDLARLDLSIFSPAPTLSRSLYGVQSAVVDGRTILNAHAPSELTFRPPSGARLIRATVGLPDGAFAPGNPAVTDGITVEIFAFTTQGTRQRLYRRTLDPAHNPADRGPQEITLALTAPLAGDLLFRLGNGVKSDPTNDWAYWARIEIR